MVALNIFSEAFSCNTKGFFQFTDGATQLLSYSSKTWEPSAMWEETGAGRYTTRTAAGKSSTGHMKSVYPDEW